MSVLYFDRLIEKSATEKLSNIVLALDLMIDNREKLLRTALEILESVEPFVCAVKLNRQVTLGLGLQSGVKRIVRLAHKLGLPTIMDAKINDVGHTNRAIAEHYFAVGFDAIISSPFVGWEEGLEPVFELAEKLGRGVLLLVFMSHKASIEGYGQTVVDSKTGITRFQYEIFTERALEWGADGAIVGATFPEKVAAIYNLLGDRVPIYSPGVGVQGGDLRTAMEAGSKYVIIGRSIFSAKKPADAAKKFREEVGQIFPLKFPSRR